jgi:hypothetical protein
MSDIQKDSEYPVSELLEQLYLASRPQTEGFHTTYLCAGNPACAEEILNYLSHCSSSKLRTRVAENPGTPVFVLLRLGLDPDPRVREAVSENFHAPEALLQSLADDESCDVRYSIAENPSVPLSILNYLCGDNNPYVAFRARKTLDFDGCYGDVRQYAFQSGG